MKEYKKHLKKTHRASKKVLKEVVKVIASQLKP